MADQLKQEPSPAIEDIITGVGGVEIKVTVRPDEELKGLRVFKLNEDNAEVRVIYFYDTPKLELFNSGLVLRARLVKGDDDDSTVKIRPVDPEQVSDQWRQLEDFKVEADRTGDKVVCSASLTAIQKRNEIDEVAEGKRPLEKLFSKEQILFMNEFYPHAVDLNELKPLGPIRVLRWKTEHEDFPHEFTVEEWRLPNGEDLLEVSIKVPPSEAAAANTVFEEHLRSLGLDPEGAQSTKTRTALEYFAQTLTPAA